MSRGCPEPAGERTRRIADHIGIHHAFIPPGLCYIYIAYFAFRGSRHDNLPAWFRRACAKNAASQCVTLPVPSSNKQLHTVVLHLQVYSAVPC